MDLEDINNAGVRTKLVERKASLLHDNFFSHYRRGYSEEEVEAAFAKYDLDGDKVLNEEEQRKMQDDLEGQRVCSYLIFLISVIHIHVW